MREQLDIINAYQELGSYRAAARLCGTTDKTVKRALARRLSGKYEPAMVTARTSDAGQ